MRTLMRALRRRAPAATPRASPARASRRASLLAEWLRGRLVPWPDQTRRRGDDMSDDSIAPDRLARRVPRRRPRPPSRWPRDAGAREICPGRPDFADWPLNERAVIDDARALGRLAAAARAVSRTASTSCRAAPAALRRVAPAVGARRAVPQRPRPRGASRCRPCCSCRAKSACASSIAIRYRGTLSGRPVDLTEAREAIDALLQRSVEAFPSTTLGL